MIFEKSQRRGVHNDFESKIGAEEMTVSDMIGQVGRGFLFHESL